MPSSLLIQFIGGLAFFFYGIYSMGQSLTTFAGDRLKGIIARSTQSRFTSLITGIATTFFFQSSSAVTVMAVGLASSGLISLAQGMAVSLGAGIGTTFLVLLIAVKIIIRYGLLIFVIGLVLQFLANQRILRVTGEVIKSFGLVFFGLSIMSMAVAPIKDSTLIPQIFSFMQGHPFLNFLIAAAITAMVHSSGAVLGVVISLTFTGNISYEATFPLILGANIGTGFTAILASLKATTDGKRVAWANLLLRLGAALILFLFLSQAIQIFHQLNVWTITHLLGHELTVHSEVAWTHFYFNVFVAFLFLPLLPLGEKLIMKLIPSTYDEKESFGPKYLNMTALSTPSLAFAQVSREMVRMGEIVQQMFKESLILFESYNYDIVDRITSADHQVDLLYKSMKFYLAKLSFKKLDESDAETAIQLMTVINELETIGDTIERHMTRLAHKKLNKGVKFSQEGWEEIKLMHQETLHIIELTLAALSSSSEEIAVKIKTRMKYFLQLEDQYKMNHLMRLNKGLQETIDTSAIHLELLATYRRINVALGTMIRHVLTGTTIPQDVVEEDEEEQFKS